MSLRLIGNPTKERWASLDCPGCGQRRTLDEDQYFGRVSTHCDDVKEEDKVLVKGCGYHKTVNWSLEI